MAKLDVYKQDGSKADAMEVADGLFAVEVNPKLVHEVIVIQEENGRHVNAHTKDRSEVRGGGRKPWKQKGTGRARHGSRRSPIWSGGGITFGPRKDRVFGKKVNKKVKRKALAMVLSDKLNEGYLVAVDSYEMPEAKTKLVASMRAALPGAGRSTLVITMPKDDAVRRGVQNLNKTKSINVGSLNVRDLVASEYILASRETIEELQKIYLK